MLKNRDRPGSLYDWHVGSTWWSVIKKSPGRPLIKWSYPEAMPQWKVLINTVGTLTQFHWRRFWWQKPRWSGKLENYSSLVFWIPWLHHPFNSIDGHNFGLVLSTSPFIQDAFFGGSLSGPFVPAPSGCKLNFGALFKKFDECQVKKMEISHNSSLHLAELLSSSANGATLRKTSSCFRSVLYSSL